MDLNTKTDYQSIKMDEDLFMEEKEEDPFTARLTSFEVCFFPFKGASKIVKIVF